MQGFMTRWGQAKRGLIGTWAKIPSMESVELLGHAVALAFRLRPAAAAAPAPAAVP